jgi:hypothetical protein
MRCAHVSRSVEQTTLATILVRSNDARRILACAFVDLLERNGLVDCQFTRRFLTLFAITFAPIVWVQQPEGLARIQPVYVYLMQR